MVANIDQATIDALPQTLQCGPKGLSIETIIDLRQRGLSVGQIGKLIGCSTQNVAKRLAKINETIDNTHKYRKNRAFILAYHEQRISQELTDAKLKKAKFIDLVKGMSFLHNQERLEEGKSTQNIAYADMVKLRAQTEAEITALEADFGSVETVQDAEMVGDNG